MTAIWSRIFPAILPSNSPGVHSLWIPSIALKVPVILKPGSQEPWTPTRVLQALIAAGCPREAVGLYPTNHSGAAQILMDGLRRVDEWQRFAELVPSEDLVFERIAGFEAFRDRQDTPMGRRLEHAKRVYGIVDGRLRVRRVIDLSRLGSFDATRALAALCEANVIAPLST